MGMFCKELGAQSLKHKKNQYISINISVCTNQSTSMKYLQILFIHPIFLGFRQPAPRGEV